MPIGLPRRRHSFRARLIRRYDPRARIYRVGRIVWQCGDVGAGAGHSAKLTLALAPRWFHFGRNWGGCNITIAGLRLHYVQSRGGIYV